MAEAAWLPSRAGSGPTPAERFLTAWKVLEQELGERWDRVHAGRRADMDAVLRWAVTVKLLTAEAEDFLQSCRRARNAYVHVAFPGYVGPIALPPEPVVQRVERLARSLRTPERVGGVARPAVTCSAETPLREALHVMRTHDFSQLPYEHVSLGWVLVTRDQVARWVEVQAEDDGTLLADLSLPVGDLADDARIGPTHPVVLSASAPVAAALARLEEALRLPDQAEGGYPVVLVAPRPGQRAKILSSDDLPRLYDLLGR